MTRRMSERAAWLWLAKRWEKAKTCNCQHDCGMPIVVVSNAQYSGLCGCVVRMCQTNKIDGATAGTMLRKIAECGIGFIWPLTAAGARARVRFCLKQAAKLERKGKVK